MTFSFGQTEYERLEVDVLRYERDPVGEYFDDNWLTTQISVSAGGFRGQFHASILTGELREFLTQLRLLYESLSGNAEFSTLEEQLHLLLTGDGNGQIELTGQVVDQPGSGNPLHFGLRLDQTQLGAAIRDLEAIVAEFPIR
jgi:hypothetical protein